MNLKHLLSRSTINKVSRFNCRKTPLNYTQICTSRRISPPPSIEHTLFSLNSTHSPFHRFIHSSPQTVLNDTKSMESVSLHSDDNADDAIMNEFLSRFVWIMRGKLTEVYTDADKKEIDAMLHVIVAKVVSELGEGCIEIEHLVEFESAGGSVSDDFSEDLWETVKEVSSVVLEDMKKAKKKEKMKSFLQSEEVKEMARFAGEIGIRGDMLRELRFKWAREKLEDSEFYDSLERLQKESIESFKSHEASVNNATEVEDVVVVVDDDDDGMISLPKRSGKIEYKIYGLDLSTPKWAEVAEQIHEVERSIEPKLISWKCKVVTEKIVSLQADDDPSRLIAEWIELLQPSRVDWLALLDRLKQKNDQIYFKVLEYVLDEESFETSIRDYSQLVDAYAKHNRLDDAERICIKMNVKGIVPDILTLTTMVHMYSKAGDLNLAKQAFESLKKQGFRPDLKVYNSMIMAYVDAGDPKSGEFLMRDLESKNFKPSEDMYLAIIRSYAQNADTIGASRISNRMQIEGYQPGLESNTYFVEAYAREGNLDKAREHFDDIVKLGFKPYDNCVAQMIAGYARKNYLDKAVQLLLELEKAGAELGPATYLVLIEWLGNLQLIDEVEDLLEKFTDKGFSPSLDVHASLCGMYARAREEKKALQALGVLEANKDKLGQNDFEKVIRALSESGFRQDAARMADLMVSRGFTASNEVLFPGHL